MIRTPHYVPLLRHKRGEWTALNNTSSTVRSRLVPILEIVPEAFERRAKTAKLAGLDVAGLAVRDLWTLTRAELDRGQLYLDAHLLNGVPYQSGAASATLFAALTAMGRLNGIIPVVHPDATDAECVAIAEFAATHASGAAIRCARDQLLTHGASSLSRLAKRINLKTPDVDVIVDLACDPASAPYIDILEALGGRRIWRSWTVLSGVFPRDLTSFSPKDYAHLIERAEWLRWIAQSRLVAASDRPNFGDYTVQHGIYVPQVRLEGSQSVRYTLDGAWRVLRGKKSSIHKKTGGVGFQYHAHARYLTGTAEFYGAKFSWGDGEIASRAMTPPAPPGGAPQWISFAINHHLTVATEGVAAR